MIDYHIIQPNIISHRNLPSNFPKALHGAFGLFVLSNQQSENVSIQRYIIWLSLVIGVKYQYFYISNDNLTYRSLLNESLWS